MNSLVELVSPLGDQLFFYRMEGDEDLTLGAEYRLVALSRQGDLSAEELLGHPISVRLLTPTGRMREFNGIAAAFEQCGSHGRLHEYRITLRPWTWLLTRTSDCRIFQDKSTPEIIANVFSDHELADFRLELGDDYPRRTYCVQYRETDYDFISRLMEQEGMHGYWQHEAGRHTIVIADRNHVHDTAPGYESVSFLEPEQISNRQSEGIRRWSSSAEIQTGRCVLRDFDFEKPRADLEVSADVLHQISNTPSSALERFDYPGSYSQRDQGERLAKIRVESLQHGTQEFRGECNVLGLASGRCFVLQDHPYQDPRQQFLIVAASYRVAGQAYETGGQEEEFFSCRFRARPVAQPFTPELRAKRPMITGPQTAIVVGRTGEEIHTDRFGRIKVQFHWDRYGGKNENSSCWIRVAQPWAGQNWGMIAIPRVGQEVVVEFLDGDPDRPIVIGRVFNAEQQPPYELPAHMTQSGVRSHSTQQGGVENFNEIRFEDLKGAEELRIHAERDQTLNTEHDRVEFVGNDSHLGVGHDLFSTIQGESHLSVARDAVQEFNGELHRKVAKDSIEVVEGERHLTVKLDSVESVEGEQSLEIGADRLIRVEKSQLSEVLQDWQLKVNGRLAADANQEIHLKSGLKFVLEAGVQISLVAGSSFVDIGPGGVTISGALVMINSGGSTGSGSGSKTRKPKPSKQVKKPKMAKPPPA